MPRVDVVVETPISASSRARQLEGLFDVPPQKKARLEWSFEAPIETDPWNVGLIVGPSGAGKSTIARHLFGEPETIDWSGPSVLDDFRSDLSVAEIADACQSVGFGTIPAWLRPFGVLSNGERFRVELARRIVESDLVVFDEFSSVVDRQVAKIASHAVQKYVRKRGKQFVAVTCHYDVEDWLDPDWVIEPATRTFRRRSLQGRPKLDVTISQVDRAAWSIFAPYHYMSADLLICARCFALWVEGRIAAFCGVRWTPISTGRRRGQKIYGVSRVVTLPDFQGLGLAFVLVETVAGAYRAIGERFRNYPAHPAYVRAHDRSRNWALVRKPGRHSSMSSPTSNDVGGWGGRPCAVFEFVGPAIPKQDAITLLGGAS